MQLSKRSDMTSEQVVSDVCLSGSILEQLILTRLQYAALLKEKKTPPSLALNQCTIFIIS